MRLQRLTHNFKKIRKDASNAPILVVLKSDAYGHGHCEVASVLEKLGASAGLFGFGVANVEEGIDLRRKKIRLPILVMSGIQHFDEEMLRCLNTCTLTPVISSLRVLKELDAVLQNTKQSMAVHLKFNTGMNRLGIDPSDLPSAIEILKRNKRIQIEGVMSHYSASDKPKNTLTVAQRKNFSNIQKIFQKENIPLGIVHMANSGGIKNKLVEKGSMARVGLHLYGVGNPSMEPVARWTAQVYQIRDIAKGESVGYGPLFKSKRKMSIAILGVGYADGYRRAFSNRADVIINGKRCRVLGAVSMDLTAVDITNVRGVSESSRAVLLGEDGKEKVTVEELAKHAKCIPWEILTNISTRVPRTYIYE